MASPTAFEQLRTSSFFSDVSADDLKKLAELCRTVEIPAHKTIFEEYAPAREVYVIVSGEISLAICEPVVSCRQIAVVRAGELMGWSSLVGRARLYDTARTMTPVTALAFDGNELMKFCAANPSFGFTFMHLVACTLAERLSGTRLQLLELSGVNLPEFQMETD
jgi:CRP-like cAMP-binding protein